MADLEIRDAEPVDLPRIREIMFGEPGPEWLSLGRTVDRARRLAGALMSVDLSPGAPGRTVVACHDGNPVGVLQYSRGAQGGGPSLAQVKAAVAVLGPVGVVRMVPRLRARARVDHAIPDDAVYLAEVHVDPALRGNGIGGQLLDVAEERARTLGVPRIVLTTTTSNPARQLYERKGYTVTATRTDPHYERYTGSAGRILMEKPLRP